MFNDEKLYIQNLNEPKFISWIESLDFDISTNDDFIQNTNEKINTYINNIDDENIINDINDTIIIFTRKYFDVLNKCMYLKTLKKLFALNLIISVNNIINNSDYYKLYYKFMNILSTIDTDNIVATEYRCHLSSLCDLFNIRRNK